MTHRTPLESAVATQPPPKPTRVAPPPRRRIRWFAWLIPAAVGAVIAGLAVSDYYESATLGERIDATVERGENAVRGLGDEVRRSADGVVERGSQSVARAAGAVGDVGITASVKTALAADPALSALKIEVDTREGIVTLRGPAPTIEARDRATVLARAPQGVVDVRNELALPTAQTAQTAQAQPTQAPPQAQR
ncbi:BON domain-containing protein [Aquincola sp. S2]|uniref:BON domain-containing protein n=1 Tax=Pseudaquabacterium terrae TaxID=2732868 RepID=A0ABX2ENL3_9BURK|nr:BON domain-containing protein [Aquabacterium terrae]NRF70135.1 BON domain-containing protein [Aquabacterium terrae]